MLPAERHWLVTVTQTTSWFCGIIPAKKQVAAKLVENIARPDVASLSINQDGW